MIYRKVFINSFQNFFEMEKDKGRLIDPVTGLPVELLPFEEIEKEELVVKVKMDLRKSKKVTIVEGLSYPEEEMRSLLKEMKRRLSCGGTFKDGVILLQGDHRREVKRILMERGIPEERIEVL